ncbi:mammalian cell entry protein [Mycobacterium alsense]|uniref:MCE family protein n=1 Tax=Mycobacterium alsense TaxID=324058 RepID=A0AA42C2B4_9MYCO|nr:MlaD family protein [Mycobacterium alsense]MCV7381324.1 MCE family protein [Mycobacterium alsense]OQZ90655.1 mammalian cell entry protein [Mycobacterium alsense]
MHLPRRIILQLGVFGAIALLALTVTFLHFVKLPAMLLGVGRYTVRVELPQAAGLYGTGNVTYRGSEVGRVESVRLTDTGVEAVLSLKSGIDIPSDLRAEVHSQTAIGETYVALLPRNGTSPPLHDGDVIPLANTSVPPDINELLGAANTALAAIPRDNLRTVINESYTAVGGLGPELSRLVAGSSKLAIDARENLDPLVALIDQAQPVLDSQAHSADAIAGWAAHLATVTTELRAHDGAVAGTIDKAGPALAEASGLIERLRPTLPLLLANLVSVGQVALTYQNDIEQLLVVFPMAVAADQAGIVANLNTKQAYRGQYLSFNLNLNLPPPCTTGFLPAQQQRVPSLEDYPNRPGGDLYCRVPQDSWLNVRGARNTPCETVPGKRAPTVKMCESDEHYVPLNDGSNWKGDPNATLSGQDIPQPPPLPLADYDPATGTYTAPDGHRYTRSDLGQAAPKDKTWQAMLLPPGG